MADLCREAVLAERPFDGAFRYVAYNTAATDAVPAAAGALPDAPPLALPLFSLFPAARALRRVTVTLTKPSSVALIVAPRPADPQNGVRDGPDVLAVLPTSERSFTDACCTLEADLVTFALAEKLPFRLHVPTLRTALARGVFFEINVGPFLGDDGPPRPAPHTRRPRPAAALRLERDGPRRVHPREERRHLLRRIRRAHDPRALRPRRARRALRAAPQEGARRGLCQPAQVHRPRPAPVRRGLHGDGAAGKGVIYHSQTSYGS